MCRILATLTVVGTLLFSAGSTRADWDDANKAFELGNFATAFREIKPLAEQGDVKAQFTLGVMLDAGKGVPENDTEAVNWFRKAAEQGHAAAQSNLGLMYVLGIGVPEDYVKAHMWFSISKANGDGTAAKGLANVKKRMLSARRL